MRVGVGTPLADADVDQLFCRQDLLGKGQPIGHGALDLELAVIGGDGHIAALSTQLHPEALVGDGDQVIDVGQGLDLEIGQGLADQQRLAGQLAGDLVAQLVVLTHLVLGHQMAGGVHDEAVRDLHGLGLLVLSHEWPPPWSNWRRADARRSTW
ncbi:hypothetical protein D9M69_446980 [compost metagenome]